MFVYEEEQRDFAEEAAQAAMVAEERRGEEMGEIIERAYDEGFDKGTIVRQFTEIATAIMHRRTTETAKGLMRERREQDENDAAVFGAEQHG